MVPAVRLCLVVLTLLSSTRSGSWAGSASATTADVTERVVEELRAFVGQVVEPAILELRRNETGSQESCFADAAGRWLRGRCCVYFSNVAGSLIESRYGTLRARGNVRVGASAPPPLHVTYELMAKWLLSNANDPLAIGLGAERVASIAGLHASAKGLPGPTGRYQAQVGLCGRARGRI